MRRTDMQEIRDILTLRYELGLSFARISGALGVCRGTVSNVLAAAGLPWPLRAALSPPGGRRIRSVRQGRPVAAPGSLRRPFRSQQKGGLHSIRPKPMNRSNEMRTSFK